LNLEPIVGANCVGIAFEFAEQDAGAVLSYLGIREGDGFELRDGWASLSANEVVETKFPIYRGRNIILGKTVEQLLAMVLKAKGTSGQCRDYVKSIAEKLDALNISDPAVSELWAHVQGEP
jgi:cation transport regulator ChaC